MRCIRILISFLAIFSTIAWAAIDTTTDLYTARVLVTSRSEEGKTAGFQAGLKQVYMKLTAKPDITPYKLLVQSLENAPDWVERFQYQQMGDDTYMIIRFNQAMVKEALDTAEVPYSDSPRPKLMAWTVMDVQKTPIVLTEQQLSPEALQVKKALMDAASRWGMTLAVPSGEGTSFPSPSDISGTVDAPLIDASHAEGADGFLAITLTGQDPAWHLIWRMTTGEAKADGTADGTLPMLFDSMLSSAAAAVMNSPASTDAGDGGAPARASSNEVTLVISHVDDLESYMRIDAYLNTLPGVANVETVEMAMPTVTFQLTLKAPLKGWKAALASEDVLGLDSDIPENSPPETFYYHYVNP